ncbi:MAG: hypothetical protein RR425_03695 [Erysipelotrichales bacterium]
MENIVLSTFVKQNVEMYDVVISNVEFVTEGYKKGLLESDFNYDALCAYYVDFADELILFDGFKGFLFKSRNNAKIKKIIVDGFTKLELNDHLTVFEDYLELIKEYDNTDIYELEGNVNLDFHNLNSRYRLLDSSEVEDKNGRFLLENSKTIFLDKAGREKYIEKYINNLDNKEKEIRKEALLSKQPQYIKDIVFLCEYLNEDLEEIKKASLDRFNYHINLCFYFTTKTHKNYYYVDLGYEIVLLNEKDEEIRRFSRQQHKLLKG